MIYFRITYNETHKPNPEMKQLLTLLLFIPFLSIAQNYSVKGQLALDDETAKLGQITIYSLPDSTLRKGSYLDSSFFSILFDKGGQETFYGKIKVPGYVTLTIPFDADGEETDLGLIKLEKNMNLDEVDVVYRKPEFKRTMDGISVNVDGTNLQTLTNLFEILKASPKITSPDDETIEIIGRGSPLILVDRQPIISNDELKAIPANQIEKIEIITNPSAKYRAQGSSNGVIEVYTKDFHLEGYNMTIRGEGGMTTQLRPAGGLSLGLSLKKKKFSLNGYFGANYNAQNGFGETLGTTTDTTNRQTTTGYEYDSHNTWQYYSVKSAYRFDEKQRLTIGVNGHGSVGGSDNFNQTGFLVDDIAITNRITNNNSRYTWLNNSAFANYTIETDTNKSTFEINLNYTNKVSGNLSENRSRFNYLPTNDSTLFELKTDARSVPNVGELRMNYEHNFDTTGWRLNVGGSYSALMNGQRFDQFNDVDGAWVIDPNFSNSYDYQEHIGAVFAEVSKNWDKVSVRAGIRGEYTWLDGYSNSLEQQFIDSSYLIPFPSASILIEPNEKVGITVYYDAGIDRPQFSNYDPFVRVQDSLRIEYGNPFLRPAIEQTIGFDIDLFYAYNLSFNYNHIKDPTSTISFIDDNSFLVESTPWNAESEQSLSASFSIPIQTSWLNGWNSIWIDYSKYTFTPLFEREPFFNLTYGVYSYLSFNLPGNITLTNRVHLNKWGDSETVNNTRANWGMRLTKKMYGNNFQLFLDVGNIIPPRFESTSISGNYEYMSSGQNQFTTFKLGAFIKFGRLKAPNQIQESSSGQSDRL